MSEMDELAAAELEMRSVASDTSGPVSGELDARDVGLVMAEYDRRSRQITEIQEQYRILSAAYDAEVKKVRGW